MSFERNLERWESGDMSADELASAHPGEDVEELLALYERMSAIAAEPVPLDETALQRFLTRLPARTRPRRRYRSVLLAAAAVLLMGSMAVAVPGVQRGVTAVTHGVGRILGISAPPPEQPAPSVPRTTSPGPATPSHGGGSGGAAGPSDHPNGGHGGDGTDGDEHGGTTTATEGGGDQGQDQQGDGGSAGQDNEGSGSSDSSDSSSGSGSGTDEQGDGSGGDTQSSSDGASDGQS